MTKLAYPVTIEPLPDSEGGGYLATVPDLPGCMSDGDTPAAAVTAVEDAIAAWIEAATNRRKRSAGWSTPSPKLSGL